DFTSYARTSQLQLAKLPRVSLSTIKPGDLVIYSFSSHAAHVALYTAPIGPGGADLIDTASRHAGGGVGWSKMSTRGGQVAGVVRPAPYEAPSTAEESKPATETPKTESKPVQGNTARPGAHKVVKG